MPAPQKPLPLKLSVEQPRRAFGRWAGAVVLMVGIHVSGAAIGMMQWDGPIEMPRPLPPAIMIDLQPMAVVPPPPTAAPEPEAEKAEIVPPLPDDVPVATPDSEEPPLAELEDLPPPPPEVTPVVEVPKQEKKKEKKKEEKKVEKKKQKEPEKAVEKKEKKAEQQVVAKTVGERQTREFKTAGDVPSKTMIEVPKAQQNAALPAGPSVSDLAAIEAARASWESQVGAHLMKYKKYPRAAKRRNQEGMPTVEFVIDRAGYVKDVYLVSSSGHEALDEEAVATIRRAAPLPAVPAEIAGATISRSVPINFTLTE